MYIQGPVSVIIGSVIYDEHKDIGPNLLIYCYDDLSTLSLTQCRGQRATILHQEVPGRKAHSRGSEKRIVSHRLGI